MAIAHRCTERCLDAGCFNRDLDAGYFKGFDLRSIPLEGASLRSVNFDSTTPSPAWDLRNYDLTGASIRNVDLRSVSESASRGRP